MALSTVPDDEYVARSFIPTRIIELMHSIPRFGHTDNIGYAASSDGDVQEDYILGAVFLSAFILLVFFVWLTVLIIFKCLGSRQVGCAAGTKFKIAPFDKIRAYNANQRYDDDSEQDEEQRQIPDIEHWEAEVKWVERRARRTRTTFLFSALLVLAASAVLILLGLIVLDNAYKTTQESVKEMGGSITNAATEVKKLIIVSNQTKTHRDSILDGLSNSTNWCPNAAANPTTPVLGIPIANVTSELVTNLNGLSDFNIRGAITLEETLQEASTEQEEISFEMDLYSWWFYVTLGFILLLDLLCIIFICGVITAWCGKQPVAFNKFQTFIAMPIFSFLVNISWLFTSGFALAAVLNADVCTGSPEENLVAIFHEKEAEMNPLLFGMTKYYVEGCASSPKPDKPTAFVDSFDSFVDTAITSSKMFLGNFTDVDPDQLASECGSNNVAVVLQDLSSFSDSLASVSEGSSSTIESLRCSNFNPIATGIFHDAICYDSADGLAVIFVMLFVIVVCSMIMITLRVSWQPVADENSWVAEEAVPAVAQAGNFNSKG